MPNSLRSLQLEQRRATNGARFLSAVCSANEGVLILPFQTWAGLRFMPCAERDFCQALLWDVPPIGTRLLFHSLSFQAQARIVCQRAVTDRSIHSHVPTIPRSRLLRARCLSEPSRRRPWWNRDQNGMKSMCCTRRRDHFSCCWAHAAQTQV